MVVDPVMVSTSGHLLAAGSVAGALLSSLFPLAEVITPNLPEASALLGGMHIGSVEDMERAAVDLFRAAAGVRCVLVKGGHLPVVVPLAGAAAKAQSSDTSVVDVFYDGTRLERLTGPRIHTANTHGTGGSTGHGDGHACFCICNNKQVITV